MVQRHNVPGALCMRDRTCDINARLRDYHRSNPELLSTGDIPASTLKSRHPARLARTCDSRRAPIIFECRACASPYPNFFLSTRPQVSGSSSPCVNGADCSGGPLDAVTILRCLREGGRCDSSTSVLFASGPPTSGATARRTSFAKDIALRIPPTVICCNCGKTMGDDAERAEDDCVKRP